VLLFIKMSFSFIYFLILSDKNDTTLGDLQLMPAAVICFEWDADVLRQLSSASPVVKYLRADVIRELMVVDDA
jgi:hypothetical protein